MSVALDYLFQVCVLAAYALFGCVAGVLVFARFYAARWWERRLRNPETAREALNEAYVQTSREGGRQRPDRKNERTCPCCGFVERVQ